MQTLKKYFFGKQKAKVNTYIGGIGGTINTPDLLASRLGIGVNRIKSFKVTGVDVECAIIGGSYNGTDQQGLLTEMTYYDDREGLLIDMAGRFIRSASSLKWVNFPKLKSAGDENFVSCPLLDYINLPLFETSLGGYGSFRINSALKSIVLPNLKSIKALSDDSGFTSNGTLAILSIPRCTELGVNQGRNVIFNNSNLPNLKIYANPIFQTSNAGAEEGDIAYARSQGATIQYVTDFTSPNHVTNLSVGTIYNTAVQLNFTPPSSTNAIDFYEVYLNNSLIPYAKITSSGQYITGLTPLTNYNITVVAVDIFYNKSIISNVVNVSTNTLDYDVYNYISASSNQSFETPIVNLFTSLKSNNLYNKIQAFYPFLGTTQAQHKWNAKNAQDTSVAFRLVFSGGGTHSNLGYQCNGTNAYANTNFVPSANTSVANSGITIVSGTNNAAPTNNTLDFGVEQGSPFPGFELALRRRNGTVASDDLVGFIGTFVSASQNGVVRITDNDIRGITTVVSTSLASRKLFQNSQLLITDTKTTTSQLPTIPAYIGCLNNQGSPFGYSNQRIQFVAIHEGLTDTEVQTLHTIIDAFETAIGRKTW